MDKKDQTSIRNERRKFHLDRSISIPNIIAIVAFFVSALWWAAGVEKSVEANAMVNDHQDQMFEAFKSVIENDLDDIDGDLETIDSKLDKIISGEY